MMQRLVVLILSLLLSVSVSGKSSVLNTHKPAKTHTTKKAPLLLYKDTTNVLVKHFDAKAISYFKKDPEFNYTDYAGAGEPSFLEKVWLWILNLLFGWTRHAHIDGTWLGFFLTVLKYLFYAALIAFVVFVVIKAIGLDPINLFRRKAKKVDLPYSELIEDIHEIDFDDELEKALAQNNYRLAVRLLYLHCLKHLSDLQLIHWQLDKTNSAYVNELADPKNKQTFSLITRQFEYVWYGNFSVDKQAFSNIRHLFQDFKQQLP
jgi:hypothetical protein